MGKIVPVLQFSVIGLVLLPFQTCAIDGFMNDFFQRFPNLPFANMNTLRYLQDQGGIPVKDSLLKDDHTRQFKRQIAKSDRLTFKSKVLSEPKSDPHTTIIGPEETTITMNKSLPAVKSTTPRIKFARKRILYLRPTPKPYTANSYYFDSSSILSTTPSTENQFRFSKSPKPILSTLDPYDYSLPSQALHNLSLKNKTKGFTSTLISMEHNIL